MTAFSAFVAVALALLLGHLVVVKLGKPSSAQKKREKRRRRRRRERKEARREAASRVGAATAVANATGAIDTAAEPEISVADEVTEEFAEAMDEAIGAAAKAESERDALAAQLAECNAQLEEHRAQAERTRILFPVAHQLVADFQEDMFMHSYAEAATVSCCDHKKEAVKVPESAEPVRLDDPLCRAEMVRILRSLGYQSELLDVSEGGFRGSAGGADFQITAHEGDVHQCAQCGSEWRYDIGSRVGGEWHKPGCRELEFLLQEESDDTDL